MRNRMKQKLAALFLLLGISLTANAQFGGLLGGSKASGGAGADPAAIEKFTADAALINKAISYAALQIVAALGDKDKLAIVKESLEKMKSSDPKDQNAVMGTVFKTDLAASIDLLKSKEGKERMEKLSPDMQKKVAKSIFAVGVAAFRLKPLLDNGQKALQSMGSNPAMLSKIGLVKDSLSLLGNAAPKVPDLVTAGLALMKEVKVDPGNPTADSVLTADADVTIPES